MKEGNNGVSSLGTIREFLKVGACSTTLCSVIDRGFGYPAQIEEQAATFLAGGILARGYQCGQLWGAVLAAGAQAYRRLGPGTQAQAAALITAGRLVETFRVKNGEIDCRALTKTDWRDSKNAILYMLKGGPVRCFLIAGAYGPQAFCEINAALAEWDGEAPSGPVSCAGMLAEKAGVSGLHTAMAAGLAGGIGLCGGACGALGAAVWVTAMNVVKEGKVSFDIESPAINAVIDAFLEGTGGEFTCSKIAGRRFESLEDHAAYLREGGCGEIIDGLAARIAPVAAGCVGNS